jgi:stress response protein YsnF
MIANELDDNQANEHLESASDAIATKSVTETVIPLLAERLIAESERRKTGEIVVRKEIASKLVQMQVPVRYERLVVERVDPEYELIATIDLDDRQLTNNLIDRDPDDLAKQSIVLGEVDSPQVASDLLRELANISATECEAIKIEIVLNNAANKDNYQQLIDRYTHRN